MPLVVLVAKSLAVSWNGTEVDGDDVPPLGPRGLVLFLPCCLEPVQMSHIVSYLARTLVFLQQLKHVDLPQVAFQGAALPRPADFLRERRRMAASSILARFALRCGPRPNSSAIPIFLR